MNNLLKKYLSGQLNREELDNLRTLPEREISDSLQEDWDNYFADLHEEKTKDSRWKKFLLTSAAVLIPILILSTILLWNRTNVLSSQDIVITTAGNGERASVTLPDGSVVTLNSNSCLSYKPEDFTGDTRAVAFEGEGYFTVTKSERKRFIVHTSLVSVNVKGTTFNLLSRSKSKTASLYLESGSVELRSVASGNIIDMKPGDFARLDADGIDFIREEKKDPKLVDAWRQGEFIFINQSLKEVTKSLEYNFNTKIVFENPELEDIHFTGTLPNRNLLEAVRILELSFGLQCTQKGDEILFSAKK